MSATGEWACQQSYHRKTLKLSPKDSRLPVYRYMFHEPFQAIPTQFEALLFSFVIHHYYDCPFPIIPAVEDPQGKRSNAPLVQHNWQYNFMA